MSRTLKDKNPIYHRDDECIYQSRSEHALKRRYFKFKKSGPPLDGEECPDCGGLTDFQSGYLTCSECGWTDDVTEMCEMEGFSV